MEFAMKNLTAGQLNAIVKKLGGEERALRFLNNEVEIPEVHRLELERLHRLNDMLADWVRHLSIRLPKEGKAVLRPESWTAEESNKMYWKLNEFLKVYNEYWDEREELAQKLNYGIHGCNRADSGDRKI